ncbi:hypothetical protein Tco_0869934 [Tanacetum coccineum]
MHSSSAAFSFPAAAGCYTYTDSDYAGASLDRKSTTGGCQFLRCRLILWQCKKQTVVANSTTEAEYVAALSCRGQVLWIQNQLLDYGYNFMHTKIYIDNESTICIVKNPVFHSETKYIEIRHHFIRDSNEKKLIQMIKIHIDKNVADLLTKAFGNGIGVNAGDSKVTLLGINLLLLGKVNAARHNLLLLVVKTVNREPQLQALVDGKKIVVIEAFVRRDLQLEDADGVDCLPSATIFEQLALMGMVKNLDNAGKFLMYPRFIQLFLYNQLVGMSSPKRIYVTPSHTKKIFANKRRQGKDLSGRETPLFQTMVVQAQEEMGEGLAMPTDPHHTPIITQPSSSQPQRKQKSRRPKEKDTQVPQSSVPSDPTNVADEAVNEEPSMQLKELMDFCTKLQQRMLDLENTKTSQAQKITSLKMRVNKLEKKGGSRTHKLKRLYMVDRSARVVSFGEASLGDQEDASKQGRKIHDIDADEDITLENVHDAEMFDVNDLDGDKVVVESEVSDKTGEKRNIVEEAVAVTDAITIPVSGATITNVVLTLAQTLAELKSARPKTVVMQEPSESTLTISLQLPSQVKGQGSKDKGKAKMIEPEKPLKKKDQIKFDEEKALRLQAKFDEEDRLAREVNTFVDIRTELVEGTEMEESSKKSEEMEESSSKRAGDELEQENAKKQKVDDDQEAAKIKELMKIFPDEEEVVVDAIPLATKPPSIIDWKIVKEGKINYYQIIRADGSSKRYSAFIQMLRSFDKEYLETLWKLVKAKHGYTRPEDGYERVLWDDLKIISEHHVEDAMWRNLRENKVLVWKLFDSCGEHFVRFQNLHVFMLVEKSFLSSSQSNSRINEVFRSILLALEQASPPLSPAYVPELVYLKYLAPLDDDIPIEYQPLPADASPMALSLGYIADADPEEDSKEDLEEDPPEYPSASKEEDDDDKEEEHLALADSFAIPIDDPVPSAEETEPFAIDESAPTPPSPRLRKARISVRLLPPMAASMEARIAEYAAAPTPPSSPPSPLTSLSSALPQIPSPPLHLRSPPTHTSPTYAEAPLGYRAVRIQSRATSPLPLHAPSSPLLLPATGSKEDVLEANVPPRKRLYLNAPTSRFVIRESSAAARQPRSSVVHRADYSFMDTVDAKIRAVEERAMVSVRVVNLRVNYQADVYMRESEEFYTHHQDVQDDRATAHNRALEAHIATIETQLYRMEWQRQDVNDHATRSMMRIYVLKDRAHIDTLEDTDSSD